MKLFAILTLFGVFIAPCFVMSTPPDLCTPQAYYSRGQLIELYNSSVRPCPATVDRLRQLGLKCTCRLQVRRTGQCFDSGQCTFRPYRGCRAGRLRRPLPRHRFLDNGAAVVTGNRPSRRPPAVTCSPSSNIRVHVDRHAASTSLQLVFGLLNIRSIANKLGDLLEVQADNSIDVFLLVETWHHAESVSFQRLRADGYQVVDRPRPCQRTDTLSTNHGGVAVVAAPGVRLSTLTLGACPATFELLAVRVATGSSAVIVLVVYRPGSQTITAQFFAELADALDRVVAFTDPVVVTGDFNVRLDRADDPAAQQMTDLLATYGFVCRVSEPTHGRGGLLDVVATRSDLPAPSVDVVDCGLSDHHLLRWTTQLTRPPPVYTTVTSRPWRRLDAAELRAAIKSSRLCRPDEWSDMDVEGLAQLYDGEITRLLDQLIPARKVTCRRRPSNPWFDEDCRVAKRRLRQLERTVRQTNPADTVAVAAASAAVTAQRRLYRTLRRQKEEEFWRTKVDSERSCPRALWQSVDALMGRGRAPVSDDIDAKTLHKYFEDKVDGVRLATADAQPPTFTCAPAGCILRSFRPLAGDDIAKAVRMLPDKQCTSDPMPTGLFKQVADVLEPFLVELFNRSLSEGLVPSVFKAAYVTPLLKKADLDSADAKSYRPISNLSVLSKLLERLVAQQLIDYLRGAGLLPDLQSAYRAFHSTETAVLKVMSDILWAIDNGNLSLLALLDLSSAFDTVDHEILLRRLEVSYGLQGTALSWFTSYLNGRMWFIRCRASRSNPALLGCGVPQGSVLGPILFVLYTADLVRLIENFGLHPHLYADDTQVYGFVVPTQAVHLQQQMSSCIDSVAEWLRSNRLQLNAAKTEFLWSSSGRRVDQVPSTPIRAGTDSISPASSVRNLGIYLDSNISMTTHVSKTVSSCFAALRQIRSVKRSVTRPVLLSLVQSLVLTRLDYGNATLAGLSGRLTARLQSVLHAAARLIYSKRKYEHITPLLMELHWLSVPERIQFKLAMLVVSMVLLRHTLLTSCSRWQP